MKRFLALTAAAVAISAPAFAQFEGPRVQWPLVKNTNLVTGTYVGGTANASFSVLNRVQGDVDVESSQYILSYTRSQALLGRTIHWQAQLPAGSTRTDVPFPLTTNETYADGIGDLTLGATVNLFGAPELTVRESLRYDLDLTVGLGVSVTAPIGDYDPDESLNFGSNQWSTRVSMPIVKSLGPWVPGKRTTLEVTPSVRFFQDNENALGNTVEQDPLVAIEAHLTRDMTRNAFISLDYNWLDGADQTRTSNATGLPAGATGGLNAQTLGATLGYKVNDNLNLYVGHQQTIGEGSDPFELRGSLTSVRLVWGWHDVLQRRNNFLN